MRYFIFVSVFCLFGNLFGMREAPDTKKDSSGFDLFSKFFVYDGDFQRIRSFTKSLKNQFIDFPNVFYFFIPCPEKRVFLTFDDGPDYSDRYGSCTEGVLDVLESKGVEASFFVIGEMLKKFDDTTRRILEDGHDLFNHSYDHKRSTDLSRENLLDYQVLKTQELIDGFAGEDYLKVFRPPYGAISDEQIKLLGERGFKVVKWSIDTRDWDGSVNSPKEIKERVFENIHPGAILLFHSGGGDRRDTVEALPDIIDKLKADGYEFFKLSDVLSTQ